MTNTHNRLQSASKSVKPSAHPGLPRLSATEQTKLSWAKAVKSYADVPEVFKDFFEPYLAAGRSFPYAVLTPSFQGFIRTTSEKLICDLGDEIGVLERTGSTYAAQCYPLERISCVEVTSVLLDSRIKITSATQQGTPASITLRFNSVTDYLFTPFLDRMRLGGVGSTEAVRGSDLEVFDHWARSSYKFMNYARGSLLGGEVVVHAVLQPEVRMSRIRILGKTFYKTVSPTLAVILTDRELITIREEFRQVGSHRYGGVWDYIPLDKIAALSLSERDAGMLLLSIDLPAGARLEYLVQAAMRKEIDPLLDGFKQRMN